MGAAARKPPSWNELVSALATDPTSRLHYVPRDIVGLLRPYLWTTITESCLVNADDRWTKQGDLLIAGAWDKLSERRHYVCALDRGRSLAHISLPFACAMTDYDSWECQVVRSSADTPAGSAGIIQRASSLQSSPAGTAAPGETSFFTDASGCPLLIICRDNKGMHHDVRRDETHPFAYWVTSLVIYGVTCYYRPMESLELFAPRTLTAYGFDTRRTRPAVAETASLRISVIHGAYGSLTQPILVLGTEEGVVYYDLAQQTRVASVAVDQNQQRVVMVHEQNFLLTCDAGYRSAPIRSTLRLYRLTHHPAGWWSNAKLEVNEPAVEILVWERGISIKAMLTPHGEVVTLTEPYRDDDGNVLENTTIAVTTWRDDTRPARRIV